jgi:anhydro-N-acetylmuramic acid kinase
VLSDGTELFDRDGARAERGKIDAEILEWCMADPYFQLKPPKTTGRERFGRQYARRLVDRFKGAPFDDLIATATAFTAQSIADAYHSFIGRPVDEIIIAGGGAKNPAMLRMLRERLPESAISVYEHLQEKEAMAMALIANDSLAGLATNVPSATGGEPAILGKFCV